jgi:hypothetical protein
MEWRQKKSKKKKKKNLKRKQEEERESNKWRFQNYTCSGIGPEFDFKGSLKTRTGQNMFIKNSNLF